MFQLVVVAILLWAGVGLLVSLLALLTPIASVWMLLQPSLDPNMVTLLIVVGALYWLVALTTACACGGLFYTGNWLLYQGRRSVGPTVLLVTWTLFALPALILSPVPFLFLPPDQAMLALPCLEAALGLFALVLGLVLRVYLHSEGVWSTLN